MNLPKIPLVITAALATALLQPALFSGGVKEYNSGIKWDEPKVVDPGTLGGVRSSDCGQ